MEKIEQKHEIEVTSPKTEDMDAIKHILNMGVIDENGPITEEIDGIMLNIAESMYEDGDTDKRYLVARDRDGGVVGIMGITRPDSEMSEYAATPDTAIELINAFVDPDHRKMGIAEKLANSLCEEAANKGATEVVVNSGPRYRETGWSFWTRMYGEPQVLEHRYGKNNHAMVWRKELI